MTIFAVLMPSPQPGLEKAIQDAYPNDFLKIDPAQWLISATGSVVDVVARLGIYDAKEPDKPATGSAIVLATSAYYGRAPMPVWDWMKVKLEASPNG